MAEIPRESAKSVDQTEWRLYVDGSEEIRSALGVETEPERWKQFMMEYVQKLPEDPAASRLHGEALLRQHRRYRELIEMRKKIALYMLFCLSFRKHAHDPVKQATNVKRYENEKSEALRNLPLYLVELNEYSALWRGGNKAETNVKLPDFLAGFSMPSAEVIPAYEVSQLMLQMQYDIVEQAGMPETETPRVLYPTTKEVLTKAIQYQVRMKYILPCLRNGSLNGDETAVTTFLRKIGYEDAQIGERERNAAKVLIGYLGKYVKSIEQFAQLEERGDIGEVTIQDALGCCTHLRMLGEVTANLKEKIVSAWRDKRKINFTELAEKSMDASSNYSIQQLQIMMQPVYKLQPTTTEEDKAKFRKEVTELAVFFHGMVGRGNRVKNASAAFGSRDPDQKRMAKHICDTVSTPQTTSKVLKSLGIDSSVLDKASSDEQEIAKVLSSLIEEGGLWMSDAFDLFYLTNVGGGSSFSVALKALQILDKYGHPQLKTYVEAKFAGKIIDAAYAKGIRGIEEVLASLNITDEQRREMRNIVLYVREGGINYVEEDVSDWWIWAKTNTKYVAILLAILYGPKALTTSVRWGYKTHVKITTRDLRAFVDMKGADLVAFCEKNNVDFDDVLRFQREVNIRLGSVKQANFYYITFGKARRFRKEASALKSAAAQQDVNKAVQILRSRFKDPAQIAEIVIDITDGDLATCRSALESAGYAAADIDRAMKIAEATPDARIFKLEQELTNVRAEAASTQQVNREQQRRIDRLEEELATVRQDAETQALAAQQALKEADVAEQALKEAQQSLNQSGNPETEAPSSHAPAMENVADAAKLTPGSAASSVGHALDAGLEPSDVDMNVDAGKPEYDAKTGKKIDPKIGK